jgi:hypothetical protein
MNINKLYLAWENPIEHRWMPVGQLTIDDDNMYKFVYTKGAKSSRNFEPFARMKDLNQVYRSETLFPLFGNRLLSTRRPEYDDYMEWLDIKDSEYDAFTILAITGGIRGTDTFEVFPCPRPNDEGDYEVQFFSHGLRHLPRQAIERVNSLHKGDRLFILPDIQNMYDPMALVLRTDDPVELVGYCPRYLSPDFYELLERARTAAINVYVKRVNVDAPLHLRLFCRMVAPWPDGFKPCSGEEFEPLVEYDCGSKPLHKIETPVKATGVSYNSPVGDFSSVDGYNDSRSNSKKSSGMVDYFPTGRVLGSNEKKMNNAHYGRRQEYKVANQLRCRGAKVSMSPGSRGAADLKAHFPSGRCWNVQVKSSRSVRASSPSRKDLGRLKCSASRSNATPVIAQVTRKGTSYRSARTGNKLNP